MWKDKHSICNHVKGVLCGREKAFRPDAVCVHLCVSLCKYMLSNVSMNVLKGNPKEP